MGGGTGNIDAIKVALGADLNELRSDLRMAKKELENALPRSRTVAIHVNVNANQRSVQDLYKSVQNQFANIQRQGNQNNSPQAIRIAPRMVVDPRVMRDFRRDIERNMMQAGRSGQALHVPIKFNGDIKGFIASMGRIEVPVWGKYMGWAPGGGPPEGGGGGGGGTSGPRGGSRPPTGGGTAGPTATGQNRSTSRARTSAAPPTGGRVVDPHVYTGHGNNARDDPSSDRYEAPEERARGPRQGPTRVYGSPVGSTPPTPQQQRQSARRDRMQGAVPPRPATRTTYGPGNRDTIGSSVNPGYVEPPGGRVTIGNVRSGATIEELPRGSQARADFESQQRARPTPAAGYGPQAGERNLSGRELQNNATLRRTLEDRARRVRQQQASARAASPQDQAARALFASGFHNLDPDLAAMYDILGDPTYKGSLSDLGAASSLGREAYGTAFHGQTSKGIRRQIGVARGYKKGDINAVDPTLLAYVSALDASREFSNQQADPLYAVRSGDQKGRGVGGKVGKIGGRNAGRMASVTVDPSHVQQIIERRRIGGRGNGWKALAQEYGADAVSAARSRIGSNAAKDPVDDIIHGQAYGGWMEDATPVQGGQGMSRKDAKQIAIETSRDRKREQERRQKLGAIDIDTPTYTPAPKLRDEISNPTAVPPPSFGNAGRARSSRPPRPESRAYGRNTGYTPGGSFGAGGFGGSQGFFEFLKGFKGTGPSATYAPRYSARIQKLMAMAGQTEQSPHEAGIAAELLRRRGIPGFAEGGLVPGRQLRGYIGQDADLPRVGSIARQLLEQRYLKGQRERERRAAKPTYQQGGNSDRRFRALANAQFEKDPFCAYCGKQTIRGGGGAPNAFRADHAVDVGSGGDVYDPNNIVTACNSCNSYKSGGKAARLLMPGQRMPRIGSGMAEGGMWRWGGKMRRYAEGGIVKHGGLLSRMAQAGHEPSIRMVGERGPELQVSDPNTGETEIVPTHKVPAWLQRAQEGRGLAKDMTHHAEGGRYSMRMPSGNAWRSVSTARLTSGVVGGGDITRVYVVNWPTGFGGQAATGNPAQARAASPGSAQGWAAPPGAQQNASPPPGRGTPQGAPTPGGPSASRPRISPLTKVEARRAGFASVDDYSNRVGEVRSRISEAAQASPVRALSVALGQIAQNAIGGRAEIQARERQTGRLAGRAQREITSLQSLEQERHELTRSLPSLRAGATDQAGVAALAAARERRRALGPAILEQRGIVEERTQAAETASRNILTRGQQVKTQAVGLGGIIAGTALFSTAISAFSTAAQAAVTVLDPLVQSLLGWPAAIDKVTSSIRDNIAAASGNVRAGTAAALAPSGISAQYLDTAGGNLVATGTYRAAAQAAAQAQDISRAAGASPRGLYSGTGGLFGTNVGTELFGGQAGFLENVTGRLSRPGTEGMANPFTNSSGLPGGALGFDPENTVKAVRQIFSPSAVADILGSLNPAGENFGDPGRFSDKRRNEDITRQQADVADLNKNLQSAAQYAGDAAGAFDLVTKATDDQKKAMIASAATISMEAKARAEELASAGVAVVGPGQRNLSGGQFGQYAEQQARGQLIQDPTLLLRAGEPGRRAAAFGIAAQGQFTRSEDIPAQNALQNLAQPQGRLGVGFQLSANESQKTLDQVAKNTAQAAAATEAVRKSNLAGNVALEKIVARVDQPSFAGGIQREALGGPSAGPTAGLTTPGRAGPALTSFRNLTGQIGAIGSTIQAKQDAVAQEQATLQAHEYAQQLFLANRSLGDAKDLWAGINGSTSKTIGGLQGQNILLDRQNQLLSRRAQRLSFKSENIGFKSSDLQIQAQNLGFQQSQRQINFNKAIAGFAAPGSTPEERAARINEAKLEADFAQKQLDLQIAIAEQGRQQLKIAKEQAGINRQQFGNQTKQQDNSFSITKQEAQRGISDLQKQLALLQEGHAVSIDTASAEEAIARLQKQQGQLIEEAQSYVTQGQEVRSQVLTDTQDLMKATGKGFKQLVGDVEGAWGAAFQSAYREFLVPLQNNLAVLASGGTLSGKPNPYASGKKGRADGIIGTTSGPTQFMAGEAGREHVLVLRNARQGSMNVGIGGGGTSINVGGISISIAGAKDMDEEKLANAVGDRIVRKLRLLGAG